MKALIIEDDPEIVESVSLVLQTGWPGAQLVSTHMGTKGMEMVASEDHDIIIIDLGLPDMSGFKVLERIRQISSAPIIILTVRGDEVSIVKGLESGADDYIVKPCGPLELLARMKARVRGKGDCSEELPVSFGRLYFDPQSRLLQNGSSQIRLTAIESNIIHQLMTSGERVSTYSRLTDVVWGSDYPGSVDSLRVHIRRLREKIEENPGRPEIILTKSGIGYFLAKPD